MIHLTNLLIKILNLHWTLCIIYVAVGVSLTSQFVSWTQNTAAECEYVNRRRIIINKCINQYTVPAAQPCSHSTVHINPHTAKHVADAMSVTCLYAVLYKFNQAFLPLMPTSHHAAVISPEVISRQPVVTWQQVTVTVNTILCLNPKRNWTLRFLAICQSFCCVFCFCCGIQSKEVIIELCLPERGRAFNQCHVAIRKCLFSPANLLEVQVRGIDGHTDRHAQIQ